MRYSKTLQGHSKPRVGYNTILWLGHVDLLLGANPSMAFASKKDFIKGRGVSPKR